MKNLSNAELKILERLLAYCSDELNSYRKREIYIPKNIEIEGVLNEVYKNIQLTDISFKDYVGCGSPNSFVAIPSDLIDYFHNRLVEILQEK